MLLLLLIPVQLFAQRDKEFQIRAGFGFAGYGTTTELIFTAFNPNLVLQDEDGAATVHMPLEFRYELSERWNLGLDLKWGSYLYDPDSSEGKSNRFFAIGAAGEYNFKTNEKFRWYGGFGINVAFLELEESFEFAGAPVLEIARYNGPGLRFNTGVLIFISNTFGLNFNLGYDRHNFTLKELVVNGQAQDLDFFKATLDVKGVDGTIGMVFRM